MTDKEHAWHEYISECYGKEADKENGFRAGWQTALDALLSSRPYSSSSKKHKGKYTLMRFRADNAIQISLRGARRS